MSNRKIVAVPVFLFRFYRGFEHRISKCLCDLRALLFSPVFSP